MNTETKDKTGLDGELKELWDKSIAFHGHECPGLAIGFRASLEAMKILKEEHPAEDEEIVCVTENDACGVDAVQFLTRCTLGKGNLIYRDTGKMAFSFFSRDSGKKVRLMLKPKQDKDMSRSEHQRFILTAPLEDVFDVTEPSFEIPERARHFESRACEECGEMTPEHKMRLQEGKTVCPDCFKEYTRGW